MNKLWRETWEAECNCGFVAGGNGGMEQARKMMKKHARTCTYGPLWDGAKKPWWERVLDKLLGQGSL